ncbi:unnamed protein product [Peronospora belbahrii]|uniref:Up-regulated during septation protein 1 domain-containing protein n=1 Tax=Peronospora belbahrii TaxID=622444 RepID=A0AAU9KWT5_9STRA|nr:unnamed protein product [Peronospora belbahrii]CAH0520841.1 unnamed protein product [Peronospora belbahrii]
MPRIQTASILNSITNSKTSGLLSGEGDTSPSHNVEEKITDLVGTRKHAKTNILLPKVQTHLRGMQRRLEILQRLMHEAAQQNKSRLIVEKAAMKVDPCLIAVKVMETSDNNDHVADLQVSASKEHAEELLGLNLTLPSICTEKMPTDRVNGCRDDQTDCSLSSSGEESSFSSTTLLSRIHTLQEQLKQTNDENLKLQNTVCKLEQENTRLQAETAFYTSARDGNGSGSTSSKDNRLELNVLERNRNDSSMAMATFGAPSAFQIVMEEDLDILKNHERCQYKLHELWDTVRLLKTLVETYDIERTAMKIERDDAIAEAERANVENIRLISGNNPQQKIQYLQQMKKDNQALRQKNRALNARLVKEAVKLVQEKNGYSLHEADDVACAKVDAALRDDTLQESDESSMRMEILRRMRDCCRFLQQRLERLHQAKQELREGDGEWSEALEYDCRISDSRRRDPLLMSNRTR